MATQQEELEAQARKAAEDAAEKARAEVKAQEEAERKLAAEEAKRSVPVRAIRTGYYPAQGRIRVPGAKDGSDYFDYVLRKDPVTGKLEDVLPSWMQSVDGKIKTRPEFVPAVAAPVVLEVRGQGAAATVTRAR